MRTHANPAQTRTCLHKTHASTKPNLYTYSFQVRFLVPGSMVCNLDFVESIFGNGDNPDLAENDAVSGGRGERDGAGWAER
jgi:hypothetical protein